MFRRRFRAYSGNSAPKGAFTLNKDSLQAQGLIAWYPLASGGPPRVPITARDYSGRGNHLNSRLGSPTSGVHPYGGHGMDGTSGNTGVFDADVFSGSSDLNDWPMSMSGWGQSRSTAHWAVMMNFLEGVDNRYNGLWLLDNGDSTHYAICGSRSTPGGHQQAQSTNTSPINEPLHVFGTTSRNFRRVILNGDLNGAASDTGDHGNIGWGNIAVSLGYLGDSTPGLYIDGIIWDLRFYNYEVPDAIALQMYDPSTRWELYHEVGLRSVYLPVVADAGAVNTRTWYMPGGYFTADNALINEWYAPGLGYVSEETAVDAAVLAHGHGLLFADARNQLVI